MFNVENPDCEYYNNGFCRLESDYCANCEYCSEKRGYDDFSNTFIRTLLLNRLNKKGN